MQKTMLPPCELLLHTREQLVVRLQQLYEKGYRYIVRDKNTDFVYCYTAEPKKYREFNGWGYRDPDVPNILPALPINSSDCPEISWTNRQPIVLEEWLTKYKGVMGNEVS